MSFTTDGRDQPRTVDNPSVANVANGNGTDIGAVEMNHVLSIVSAEKRASQISIGVTSVSNKNYGLEVSSSFQPAGWVRLPGASPGTGGIITLSAVFNGAVSQQWYRAVELPR